MVKNDKRKHDIKSKLIAAICMLLVSTIMMVSTTYAWFTLSTAPEVSGITTAVGANGNLEIALQPLNGDSSKITSGTGDSMAVQAAYLANVTWGNLVDVSNDSYYGLNNIMLYPAKLNTTTVDYGDGSAIGLASSPLLIPEYGADGRVSELVAETFTGVFDGKGFTGSHLDDAGNALTKVFGVRAIGTSSGMSDRQLAQRAALAAASTAASQAKRSASQSLNTNGAALGDIAIKHATASGTETYSVTELNSLLTMVNEMEVSLDYIKTALIQYALASDLATKASDDNYESFITTYSNVTLDTLVSTLSNDGSTNTAITADVVKQLTDAYDDVATAKSGLTGLLYESDGTTPVATNTTYEWDDFSSYLNCLANPSAMQVNGIEVNALKSDWTVDVETYYTKNTATETTVTTSAGEKTVKLATIDGGDYYVDANGNVYESEMDTDSTSNTYNTYPAVSNMGRLVDAVLNSGIQLIIGSGAGVYADIADFCGDYSAEITLSKISYGGMTVKNLDAKMQTATKVNPVHLTAVYDAVPSYSAGASTGAATTYITDYYGYILDLAFRTNVADSYLKLQAEAVDRIYSDGSNENTMGHGATMTFTATDDKFSGVAVKSLMKSIRIVFFDSDSGAILAYARLDESSAETADNGAITMEMRMWDEAASDWAADQNIIALEANTITELSVLVYLDGEAVTNADVANAASSMTGSMNLQFSSTATLTPMDYSDLKTGTGGAAADTVDVTVNGKVIGSVTKGQSYTLDLSSYLTDYTINSIKMGDTEYTLTDGKVTIDNVSDDIVVSVTKN